MSRKERRRTAAPEAAAGLAEPAPDQAEALADVPAGGNGTPIPGALPDSVAGHGRQTVTIKLARFEGPLDLLLHLI